MQVREKQVVLTIGLRKYQNKFSSKVIPIYFDVTDANGCKDAVLRIKSESGHLDVLVNNAGMVTYELLPMINFENLRNMFEINVLATIRLIQLTSRLMTRQKSGSIINMSSIVGVQGVKGQLAYSATKGAVISVTKSAAKELAEHNIRVNAVAPGMVGTERFVDVFEHSFKDKLERVGMGRLATLRKLPIPACFWHRIYQTYLTGQIIGVDGSSSF